MACSDNCLHSIILDKVHVEINSRNIPADSLSDCMSTFGPNFHLIVDTYIDILSAMWILFFYEAL